MRKDAALGAASEVKDFVNVGRVLKLSTFAKITKRFLPSALPLIHTGPRLSLGVGRLAPIAAEMLARNPGLGKFVRDELQNRSCSLLARIMVAVFTIGIAVNRLLHAIRSMFTFSSNRWAPWPPFSSSGTSSRASAAALREQVLDGIDLSVRDGEFRAMIGCSVTGKSTLISLAGLPLPGADEPLSALDALTRADPADEIERIWEQERKAVTLITIDVDEAILPADRGVMMTNGPQAAVGRIMRIGPMLDAGTGCGSSRLELRALLDKAKAGRRVAA